MTTREASDRQEKKIAKKIGGKQVPNSGACLFSKGDIKTDQFLIEAKTSMTPKKSYSISKDVLLKLQEEQFSAGKPYSALAFDFGDGEEIYYIITERLFLQIIENLI